MQHATTINVQPNTDMHRISGLTHQHSIPMLWGGHALPAFSLGVIVKCLEHHTQTQRINGDKWKLTSEVLSLDP
jgi:hypothetical protein